MERPRSTSKSVPFTSSSPSSVPTPLSIPTPQGIRRGYGTPLLALDADLSLSRLDRISPRQRTPIETSTPQLAAAVAEAKRDGACAPSPSLTDIPMDQFDRLLSKNIKFPGTPSPILDDVGSPLAATAVHTVLADEAKRRELLIGLQKLIQGTNLNAPVGKGNASGTEHSKAGSRNNTPRQATPPSVDSVTPHTHNSGTYNIFSAAGGRGTAQHLRGTSPLLQQMSPAVGLSEIRPTDPVPFTHVQRRDGLCRPKPSRRGSAEFKHKLQAEDLAKLQSPTSQKIIKSELSAFSETTESCSLTSYTTSKSGKTAKV